jgi:glyoxylase-like metal-dependent hydrolase (beta-lactamase superfamily II)
MEHERYGPLIFMRGENRGRYPYCHSVFIEEAGVLIDPSSNREQLKRLHREKRIKMIWLTHWHEDHLMHLDLFDDLPLWMSEQDAPPLGDIEVFLDWYLIDNPSMREGWKSILKQQFHFIPRRAERFLKDKDVIDFGSLTVEVIQTPGHSPGHLAFFFREPSILFTGDYDLTPMGPWYGDLYSSITDTIASIQRLKSVLVQMWLTCHETGVFHGPGEELWKRYEGTIYDRENKLLRVLEEPRTLEKIVAAWIFYGKPREPKDFFEFGERLHMQKHLAWLMEKGFIDQQDGKFFKK